MSVPAGWYQDPSGPGQRYFDGFTWTGNTQIAPRRFTIHYGFVVVATISLIITVFWSVVLFGAANNPDAIADGSAGVLNTFGFLWTGWGLMWTVVWASFAIHHTLQSRK